MLEVGLGRMRFTAQEIFDGHTLHSLRFDFTPDEILNRLVYKLSTEVLVEKVQEVEKEIKYPASWWQAFKLEVLPKWFRRRFPIRWKVTKVKLERCAGYPQMKCVLPPEKLGKISFYVKESIDCFETEGGE